MRKRNFSYMVDKVFWWLLISLPVIVLLLSWFRLGSTTLTLGSVLADFGVSQNNVIYTTLVSLFGDSGIAFEFFTSSDLLLYFTYFVSIEIMHLMVDFLVFIPRLCHKYINFLCQGDE